MNDERNKADQLKEKLQGKVITVNTDINLGGVGRNADRVYMLRDFKFRIGVVEGSNAAEKISDNIYLVDKSNLHGEWALTKWLFKDVEVLGGSIQILKDGQPKNLLAINSRTRVTPDFRKILEGVMRKLIAKYATDELGIPEQELTIKMQNVKITQEFLNQNNSINPKVEQKLKKFYIGKEVSNLHDSYTNHYFGQRTHDLYRYRIADVIMVNAEVVRFKCQYLEHKNVPTSYEPSGITFKTIRKQLQTYFNIREAKFETFSGEYRKGRVNENEDRRRKQVELFLKYLFKTTFKVGYVERDDDEDTDEYPVYDVKPEAVGLIFSGRLDIYFPVIKKGDLTDYPEMGDYRDFSAEYTDGVEEYAQAEVLKRVVRIAKSVGIDIQLNHKLMISYDPDKENLVGNKVIVMSNGKVYGDYEALVNHLVPNTPLQEAAIRPLDYSAALEQLQTAKPQTIEELEGIFDHKVKFITLKQFKKLRPEATIPEYLPSRFGIYGGTIIDELPYVFCDPKELIKSLGSYNVRPTLTYIRNIIRHESIHVQQMQRSGGKAEDVKQMDGSKESMKAYLSNKQELMAYAQTIIDDAMAMGSTKEQILKGIRGKNWMAGGWMMQYKQIFQDNPEVLNRLRKYMYQYLTQEQLNEQVELSDMEKRFNLFCKRLFKTEFQVDCALNDTTAEELVQFEDRPMKPNGVGMWGHFDTFTISFPRVQVAEDKFWEVDEGYYDSYFQESKIYGQVLNMLAAYGLKVENVELRVCTSVEAAPLTGFRYYRGNDGNETGNKERFLQNLSKGETNY